MTERRVLKMTLADSVSGSDWQRVKRIATEAWAQPAAERTAFATQACADDAALRVEVLSLQITAGY